MITKVWLDETNDECVECGACEACTDAVFRVENKCKVLDADYSKYEEEIKDAADTCPAGVIRYCEIETAAAPNRGTDLFEALAKANMVEKTNDDVAEDDTGYIVTQSLNFIKPKPFYTLDVLVSMRTQTLTFEFAASVLHHLFPADQVLLMGYSLGSDVSNCGSLGEVRQIRARWTNPSHKMHYASPYDIQIDRKEIKYIMYIPDIRNKYVKTKRMKVALEDLDVGDFMDFVRAQQKIVQNNLSKKKRR